MLVHLIADYGALDLAFAEVRQRLALHVPDAQVAPVTVPPFDTLTAGFVVAQLALGEGPADRIVVHNVAPRRDDARARHRNAGEPFVALRTREGVLVAGPDSELSLSFIAPHAAEAHVLPIPAEGSQFRSRDLLPEAVGNLVAGRDGALGETLDLSHVPPPPEGVIAYVDGYGNLKTTWTAPPPGARPGSRVVVRIGGVRSTAIVGDGSFAVAEGELSFAPGSSGWRGPDGTAIRFYELFLRGASAFARFHGPSAGDRVGVALAPE